MNSIIEEIIKIQFYRIKLWRVIFLLCVSSIIVIIFCIVFRFYIPIDYQSVIFLIPAVLKNILLLIIFIVIFFVLAKTYQKILPSFEFYRRNIKLFDIPEIEKWIYQDNLVIENTQPGKSLFITSSNSGALIKDHFYKNFELSCKLKIINGGGV